MNRGIVLYEYIYTSGFTASLCRWLDFKKICLHKLISGPRGSNKISAQLAQPFQRVMIATGVYP